VLKQKGVNQTGVKQGLAVLETNRKAVENLLRVFGYFMWVEDSSLLGSDVALIFQRIRIFSYTAVRA
jgi:hypothetical protein